MRSNQNKTFKTLRLAGKAVACIDWANVYGWKKSLKRDVDATALFRYLKGYAEIEDIRFYFGEDEHKKSKEFLQYVGTLGHSVVTKPVKYIPVVEIDGQKILRRKCDFDMEVCIDVHRLLKDGVNSFIFFTGDGDYEPLYKMLIALRKQVVVVYTTGHLGREIWAMKRGIFKVELKNLIPI